MSQVIVTHDKLQSLRDQSALQEQKIDVSSVTKRWRKSDISGKDPILTIVGLAVTPILVFWSLLCVAIVLTITIVEHVFRLFGRIIGGSRSLITGEKTNGPR